MNVLNVVLELHIDVLRIDIPDDGNNEKGSEDYLRIDFQVVNRRWEVVLIERVTKHPEMFR